MDKLPLDKKVILVTGAAGFIGSNLVKRLLNDLHGATIVGIDNMNAYYDPSLKEYRLKELDALSQCPAVSPQSECPAVSPQGEGQSECPAVRPQGNTWTFVKADIADKSAIDSLFAQYHFDIVVNLAAQAGVRYSIENPDAYIQSNMIGFYNILEACRHLPPKQGDRGGLEHLVYASSSSVYGGNKKVPFSTDDRVDNPVSLYAATKKSNELFAHCYSKLYDIPTTGLRFFTVYGPAGRPDMAYFGFTNKLLKGETIKIFNYGNCRRDFTYVDDIVEGIVRVMQGAPERKKGEDGLPIPPYAVYNIGGGQPENLLDFVQILQEELVRSGVLPQNFDFEAHKELVPMQPGDVPVTYADSEALARDFGFTPKITLREGLRHFAEWYKQYYK
jgi:nucleoside-diphosphate-sugar epimerase